VIVEDNFFGVGLNNWAFWVAKKYGAMIGRPYDGFDQFLHRKPDDETLENMVWPAPAHNLAALTVGELGIPGLILFMLLWARWFQMGARFLFKRNPDPMHRLGVGLFFGLCGVFLQSVTEWTFRQTHIFLTFNILVGALASLCYAKRRFRRQTVESRATSHPGYRLAEMVPAGS
jgi:O-antigen ligase